MRDYPLSGHFKLARQTARTGAFAEVSVMIHRANRQSVVLSDGIPDDGGYAAGALFGAAHALELLPQVGVGDGPFRVEITGLVWLLVDSTQAFFAYASSHAVFASFGLTVEPMNLDLASRSVILPSLTRFP